VNARPVEAFQRMRRVEVMPPSFLNLVFNHLPRDIVAE
jgi:hypothetical protein